MCRRELRGAGQQLIGLAGAAGGARGLGGLDHAQHRGIVRDRGAGLALTLLKSFPYGLPNLRRDSSAVSRTWRTH